MKNGTLVFRFLFVYFLITFFTGTTSIALAAPPDFDKAFEHYKKDRYVEAKECWLSVWKNNRKQLSKKETFRLFLGLSNTYLKLDDIEKAKRSFAYAEKMAPNSKAVARLKKKIDDSGPANMSEAIEELRYLQLVERSAPGSLQESFTRLILYFRKSIAKKKELASAHRGLAICLYYTKGSTEEIESNLQTAIKLQPADSESMFFLALVEKDRGNFPKELEYLESAKSIGLDTSELNIRLAILYDQLVIEDFAVKVMGIVEHIVPDGLRHVKKIYNNVTNVELKEKIGKLIAALEEKQKKEEEQKKKEEEEKRLKEMVIVKYFNSDG